MVAKVLRDPLHLQLNRVSELNEATRQQIITADDVAHKEKLVHWLLANESYQKAVIFTNTRAQADRLYGHRWPATSRSSCCTGEGPEGAQTGHRAAQAGRREGAGGHRCGGPWPRYRRHGP